MGCLDARGPWGGHVRQAQPASNSAIDLEGSVALACETGGARKGRVNSEKPQQQQIRETQADSMLIWQGGWVKEHAQQQSRNTAAAEQVILPLATTL
jgi:hypothetical protein